MTRQYLMVFLEKLKLTYCSVSLLPESYDIPHQVDIGNVFDALQLLAQ